MNVWIVTEIEPGFSASSRSILDRCVIHGVFHDETSAKRKFVDLCWEYVVDQECFGEEISGFAQKDTPPMTLDEEKAYFEQVWQEKWERFDSRFQIHAEPVF